MKKINLIKLFTLYAFLVISANGWSRKAPDSERAYKGYLFAYFEGTGTQGLQEHLRFAISQDAIHWKALNRNYPVVSSDTISKSGGIRDPHILRGEDGRSFYIVATDMNVARYGWGANPGIVLMKSNDLIHWTHSYIELSKAFPKKFGDAYWVWAPQTIYDPVARKYMIYFTLKRNGNKDLVTYYAYANKDFTAFEGEPKVLFGARYGSIDNDIICKDGVWHLFYKGNTKDRKGKETKNGIQQATAKSLHGKWKEDFLYLDAYAGKTPVEGSSIFKLNDSETYVLMYDLYTSGRFEYQTSTDLYHFTSEPKAFQKDFNPRHGSVISLTQNEMDALSEEWGENAPFHFKSNGNPIITHEYTADPAAFVEGDTLWLYTGHDSAGNQRGYNLKDWRVFSTTDMTNWTEYPVPLKITDFKWDRTGAAYAAHVVKRNGKYYYYISTNGSGIGVAVADRPEGPFKDALGKPLLTNKDCAGARHGWVCIDPAVFIDDDGQAYIFWGNKICYYARLKENMVEIEGEIKRIDFKDFNFTEAPWVHKYKGKYYLTYATGWPEKIGYAMADSIGGPYEYKGILSELAGNSNTTHPSIVEFKGQWYFFTHNGGLKDGGSYSRSVCAEFLQYNNDGTIRKINISTEGADRGYVPFDNKDNPVLKGYYADPEVMYSEQTGKYYIYPTSDGFPNWSGDYFKVFSSDNLKDWKDEGKILDLKKDISWAHENAWAPSIIERRMGGKYKYFYYFTAGKKIGVATADKPTGPFKDALGRPLVDFRPEGQKGGQEIDPDVFRDPASGKYYLYWGNYYLAAVELNDDMVSFDREKVVRLTPEDGTYCEGTYVFYRNGIYYFLWSENDTRSEDYRVRYATATSPLGPLTIPKDNLILSKRPEKGIYGTGHNSVLQIPGKDEWYIVYHRFRRPNAVKMGWSAGYHREVCMDKLEFNEDGSIRVVEPTL